MPRFPFRRQSPRPSTAAEAPSEVDAVAAPEAARVPDRAPVLSPERLEMRIRDLEDRRQRLAYDVEQGELASEAGNAWQERIALIQDALQTIAADRQALDAEPPAPTFAVPAIPVSQIVVDPGEPSSISFMVGPERFAYAEAEDWDNRGGMVVRGELHRTAGDVRQIDVGDHDPRILSGWYTEAERAIDALASTLFHAATADQPLPPVTSLRDIVREDPENGGWVDRNGNNSVASHRRYRRQQLRAEELRLLDERETILNQRAALIERLGPARRRLQAVDAELARLRAARTQAP